MGTYGNGNDIDININDFNTPAIWDALEKETVPTLVLVPDMVNHRLDCYALYRKILEHCAAMHNRFAILDVIPGAGDVDITATAAVFRNAVVTDAVSYGAAYFPWLQTTAMDSDEINFHNINLGRESLLKKILVADEQNEILIASDQNLEKKKIGKSINAIRSFSGTGVLVWGARTLDGNSQDWRYINVRRTMMMIEQSVKLACLAYIFEPNTASTWTAIQGMLQIFLTNLWKEGALQGSTAADAFSVAVGLGNTMTADDVAKGILNVSIKVAITHPAEFIVIAFQQQQATN